MALRNFVGGWFLAPRRRELRVDDHHLAVLRDPAVYGLTSEEVQRIGARNRVGILTAVLRNGWIRVRVPPTRDAVTHFEVWELDRPRAQRMETWLCRHGPWPAPNPVTMGLIAEGTQITSHFDDLRSRLGRV